MPSSYFWICLISSRIDTESAGSQEPTCACTTDSNASGLPKTRRAGKRHGQRISDWRICGSRTCMLRGRGTDTVTRSWRSFVML